MCIPYQFLIAIQNDRLRTTARRRLRQAPAREPAARPWRRQGRGIIQAFRPGAAAAAIQ